MAPWSVVLRPFVPPDAELLADWGADPAFCAHADWKADATWRERRDWAIAPLPEGLLRFAAVVADEVVGYVDLHGCESGRRELGYVVGGRERWGQGYGTALARAGPRHGFCEAGLDEIWAEALDANVASVRVLQRVGMHETGRGGDATFLGRPTFYRQFALSRAGFAG